MILLAMVLPISLAPAAEQEKPDEATQKIFLSAQALRKDGKNQEAEKLLAKAIAEGNNHIILHMGLALTYIAEKNYEKASESYGIVWKRTGDVNMLESYAVSLSQLKDVDKLRGISEELVAHFEKLKEGRLAVFMVAATDGNQNLFNRAIVKIPTEELRQDKQLASIVAMTSKQIAHENLAKEK